MLVWAIPGLLGIRIEVSQDGRADCTRLVAGPCLRQAGFAGRDACDEELLARGAGVHRRGVKNPVGLLTTRSGHCARGGTSSKSLVATSSQSNYVFQR